MTMFRKILLKAAVALTLLLGVLSVAAFPRSHVSAAPAPVTYGDVQAMFHNVGGGLAKSLHINQFRGRWVGAPTEDFSRAILTPLSLPPPGPPVDAHKCVDDWHLVYLVVFTVVDNQFLFTREQAIADLQATSVSFTLDGVSLPIKQTSIAQMNVADQRILGLPGVSFSFAAGSFLAPGALSVGPHTAGVTITGPVFGTLISSNTYTVDPSGTGECLVG
jgi:hypothetical protein